MMSLKYDNFRFYWAAVTEKHVYIVSTVYAKVSCLSSVILNDKSAFSLVIDILEK